MNPAAQFVAMNATMEGTKKVIHDYDEMRKLVHVLRHNIGRVKPQTTFDSDQIFKTFYQVLLSLRCPGCVLTPRTSFIQVEQIAEELRIYRLA